MREIELEMDDALDRDELKSNIESALNTEGGVLWLTDKKGKEVVVAASKVAYVELGAAISNRSIGFSV